MERSDPSVPGSFPRRKQIAAKSALRTRGFSPQGVSLPLSHSFAKIRNDEYVFLIENAPCFFLKTTEAQKIYHQSNSRFFATFSMIDDRRVDNDDDRSSRQRRRRR